MGRRYGQHFLSDVGILQRMLDCAQLTADDTVVEIGPGLGVLTEMLLRRVGRVIAIEIDSDLHQKLRGRLCGYDNFTLVAGDALKFDYREIERFKVVSNIPYCITTPLIFKLLEEAGGLQSMTLMLQKEVARRITALKGSKAYSVLTLMVQYRSSTSLDFIVPRGAFRPPPKVDSAVVSFFALEAPAVTVNNEQAFFKVIRTAFLRRRKTIANNLKPYDINIKDILGDIGIDHMTRPERLSLEDFARISLALEQRRHNNNCR
ncbi:rRNA adenine dimethylase [Candidatus Magnetobacterium bavaricum]|uniref:Ribosomal RNA small subunit methyltransferase A n=1 Tax=Candidatus Magnetobacterium bavaricum TaxID=29290 RepID=A0A0F3GZJ8_9BACT|nr:rRNA adenine dimethylase [Candidatus Magnetobacterium bavaricum]